ncbi:DUF1510 family protein, partial [Bacillus tropicus]|uniref:DUF1510 family protein n=1 Tax=Bacillus tropicus TaxID=2026188 RepID=UPI002DC396AA|nr:DUF1510 family protein [Bacillus tropicus]
TGKRKAYGDVQDKQSGKRYYVNIDWVDNEGWKPVLVQTLNEKREAPKELLFFS